MACLSYELGGCLEEGGSLFGRRGAQRMTGSPIKAMDVVVGSLSYEKGGGLEEGELKIGPERRAAVYCPFMGFPFVFLLFFMPGTCGYTIGPGAMPCACEHQGDVPLFLCAFVCLCVPMCASVCLCVLLCASVCFCVFLRASVCLWVFLCLSCNTK